MADQPADKQLIQLAPNEMQQQDYVSTRFDVRIPQGVTPQDITNPAFWAHHAIKLKPMDEIRVHSEDGTWLAYYIVLDLRSELVGPVLRAVPKVQPPAMELRRVRGGPESGGYLAD